MLHSHLSRLSHIESPKKFLFSLEVAFTLVNPAFHCNIQNCPCSRKTWQKKVSSLLSSSRESCDPSDAQLGAGPQQVLIITNPARTEVKQQNRVGGARHLWNRWGCNYSPVLGLCEEEVSEQQTMSTVVAGYVLSPVSRGCLPT